MKDLANPGAIGLGGFALTTFILNVVNAGIIPVESIGMVLPMGLFYGGFAQFCAGMWDIKRGEIFGATCFTSYGAFWMGLGVLIILESMGTIVKVPPAGMAVFLFAWGIFTAYATVAALRISWGVTAVLATLTILFFLLAAGEFSPLIKIIAGYEGIVCAITAWYCSAAILINTVHGREIVPLGHRNQG
ncbi:MAG: acetate uptake transporter [Candidatus Bathyarchaeota archaeon]